MKNTLALLVLGGVLVATVAFAQPRRGGGGACCLNVIPQNNNPPTQPLSDTEAAALETAIQDEYKSRATYNQVLADFGQVRPFSRIVQAEGRHVEVLARLHKRYGLAVPDDTWAEKVPAFDSLNAAAMASITGEQENGALYDRLMEDVANPELRTAFSALRFATMEHHLPAFQRFVSGPADTGRMGRGKGMRGSGRGRMGRRGGNGQGQGYGPGAGKGLSQGQGRGPAYGRGTGRGGCCKGGARGNAGAGRRNGRGPVNQLGAEW
jgi:hypothetical protein